MFLNCEEEWIVFDLGHYGGCEPGDTIELVDFKIGKTDIIYMFEMAIHMYVPQPSHHMSSVIILPRSWISDKDIFAFKMTGRWDHIDIDGMVERLHA